MTILVHFDSRLCDGASLNDILTATVMLFRHSILPSINDHDCSSGELNLSDMALRVMPDLGPDRGSLLDIIAIGLLQGSFDSAQE